jgi:putative transcriptional regulator
MSEIRHAGTQPIRLKKSPKLSGIIIKSIQEDRLPYKPNKNKGGQKMGKDLTITNNIRKLRFFANEMTQLELAEKTGASRSTIIAVEAGKYTPSLDLAFRIANAFGVPIGEVFECKIENPVTGGEV